METVKTLLDNYLNLLTYTEIGEAHHTLYQSHHSIHLISWHARLSKMIFGHCTYTPVAKRLAGFIMSQTGCVSAVTRDDHDVSFCRGPWSSLNNVNFIGLSNHVSIVKDINVLYVLCRPLISENSRWKAYDQQTTKCNGEHWSVF